MQLFPEVIMFLIEETLSVNQANVLPMSIDTHIKSDIALISRERLVLFDFVILMTSF